MADAGMRRGSRAGYTAAGYVSGEERMGELYIERIQAGSAQDLLRDNNRPGYAADALDDDGLPFAFFSEEPKKEQSKAQPKARKVMTREQLTATQRLTRGVKRERGALAVCCALMVINLILLSFYGQAMIDGVRKQQSIQVYLNGAKEYEQRIGAAKMEIAKAQDGERVRNAALNELGMLRKERVATETIYIQTQNLSAAKPAAQATQEERGLLDWLLSVADIFDLKS